MGDVKRYNWAIGGIMVNWREILKNQISVSRQKLRSSKRPLPEEDEGNCREEAREIINKFKKLGEEMYALLPYTKEVLPSKKGDKFLVLNINYRRCTLYYREPGSFGTDSNMLLQILLEDRLTKDPEENNWCVWLKEFNDIKNKEEHITDKKFKTSDGHWLLRGSSVASISGFRNKQIYFWHTKEDPFRIDVGTFIKPIESWPEDAKNLIGAEGLQKFADLIKKMEDVF
jgi:hypothetical protein